MIEYRIETYSEFHRCWYPYLEVKSLESVFKNLEKLNSMFPGMKLRVIEREIHERILEHTY